MDYNELTFLCKNKKITLASLADEIGLTRQGLQTTIERGTFPISKVADLCRMLQISPNFFFGWPEQPVQCGVYAANITGGNTQNSSEAIRVLADQLKEKDRQISKLLSMLGKDGKK